MSSMHKLFSVIIIGILCLMLAKESQGTCFDDWSRCTTWSSGFTGYLWQSCQDRCVCLGREGGSCATVPNTCSWLPEGSTIEQCQCYGTGTSLSTWQKIKCDTPWGRRKWFEHVYTSYLHNDSITVERLFRVWIYEE